VQAPISYRGKPLHSNGILLIRPLPFTPPAMAAETMALGDGVTASLASNILADQPMDLGDTVSANPPGVALPDTMGLGDTAASSLISNLSVPQAMALGDAATADVLSGTNSGPYPRLNINPSGAPHPPNATYDSAGKVYVKAAAGTGEWTSLFGVPVDAGGPSVTSFFLNGNPGGNFVIFDQTHLGVAGGHTLGAAGTVYEVQFFIGLSDSSNHTRDLQITTE